MTKSGLIETLSSELNLSVGTVTGVVNTILDSIIESLVNSENVELRGFGSFSVRHYDPYTGKNPKTGEKTYVKAKKLPFFKVGKALKEAVDAGVVNK